MPTYLINGRRVRTDKPLSDDEIDEIAGTITPKAPEPEGPGLLEQANTPLWEGPAQFGRYISGSDTRQAGFGDDFASQLWSGITEHPWETAKGFGQGAIEGIGNWISGQTTPLNLATLGAAKGIGTLVKAGAPQAARALTWGARALGAPQAYEGYQTMTDPERSIAERVMGGVQTAGGLGQMAISMPPVRRTGRMNFEMEDLGNVPPTGPSATSPTQPPPRQAQRLLPPAGRTLIPQDTETFPYEEYVPTPPTDPRMTSEMQIPQRRYGIVDESGRDLGGYAGGEPTPATPRPFTPPPYRPNYAIIQEQARQEIGDILDEMTGVTQARQRLGETVERMIQQGMGREEIGVILQDMQRQRGLQDVGGVLDQMQSRQQGMQDVGNVLDQMIPPSPPEPPAAPIAPIEPTPPPMPAPIQGEVVPPPQPPSTLDRVRQIMQRGAPPQAAPVPVPEPTREPITPFTLVAPEPTPAPTQFADQVIPPTPEQAINQVMQQTVPPAAPPPRTGGLRPRQKFTQPPRPYVQQGPSTPEATSPPPPPPPAQASTLTAPPSATTVPSQGKPRLVGKKKVVGNAPSAVGSTTDVAPTSSPDTLIAASADQVEQLLSEGYKVTSRTTDGRIVMTREAPAGGKTESRTEFEGRKQENAFNWGQARAKAKQLGINISGERDLGRVHKLIQDKDPNWSAPKFFGKQEPPSEAHEKMPGAGGGKKPPEPPNTSGTGWIPHDPEQGPRGFTTASGYTTEAGAGGAGGTPPPGGRRGGTQQPPHRPGGVRYGPVRAPNRPPESAWRNWWNLSRGLLSVDLPFMTSAAFRQGLPFIGTRYWRQAWTKAAQAYGSKKVYVDLMNEIFRDELFKPVAAFRGRGTVPDIQYSIAEKLGLKFGGLEEIQQGAQLAEKIPGWGRHVAASNRAYTAFLNHLRAHTFKRLLTDAGIWDGKNITDENLAHKIADFVNTATGRGKLEMGFGKKNYSFEGASQILTDAMFSPRLMFSRIKMMNPSTYIQAPKFVRQQYTRAMMRSIGAWWTISSVAEIAGGMLGLDVEVSKDPNSADYGKIRIGDTRIDPGGGFQQFLVLASRLRPEKDTLPIDLPLEGLEDTETGIAAIDLALGLLTAGGGTITSSVSGEPRRLGEGYKPDTRASVLQNFVSSKLHPTAKMIHDIGFATERYPVGLLDRTVQLALPMMVPDIIQIVNEDPTLLPIVLGASGTGMGAQTYEGGPEEPAIIPEEYDYTFGVPE